MLARLEDAPETRLPASHPQAPAARAALHLAAAPKVSLSAQGCQAAGRPRLQAGHSGAPVMCHCRSSLLRSPTGLHPHPHPRESVLQAGRVGRAARAGP